MRLPYRDAQKMDGGEKGDEGERARASPQRSQDKRIGRHLSHEGAISDLE